MRGTDGDIVPYIAVEQHDVLRNIAYDSAQVGGVELLNVGSVDQDAAAVSLVEIHNQPLQSTFPRSHGTHDGDLFTPHYRKAAIANSRDLLLRIGEGDRSEFDVAFQAGPMQELVSIGPLRSEQRASSRLAS